jgi:uncharacterized membrane protein
MTLDPPGQSPLLRVTIEPPSQRVRAGDQAVFVITLENRSEEAQTQSISIGGIGPDWYRLEFDSQRLAFPREQRSANLYVSVPSNATPGNFQVEVMASGGSASSRATCDLEVTPAAGQGSGGGGGGGRQQQRSLSAEAAVITLTPSEVVWMNEQQGFERLVMRVRNPGPVNAEYALNVDGLERGWYTVPSRVRVPAGQTMDYELRLEPPARARPGDYAFTLNSRVEGVPATETQVAGKLTVGSTERAQAGQRGVAPLTSDQQPVEPRVASEPALPPEISLSPRTSFRFAQGEVAAQAILTVQNRSRLIERYVVTMSGLSEEWYTFTTTEVRLEPGGSTQIPLRLTPKVTADYPAGNYDFRIRVAPVSYPDSFAEVGGVVTIAGVASFDARLTPAQTSGRKEKFKLTLLNTGGVPLSLWLEASDPEGLCKFKYPPPPNLEPGQEAVVPIWVGANRQGFAGSPKRLDFRLRVSPAGGTSQQARSFDARFVHTPFLGGKMLGYAFLLAIIAMIAGVALSMGETRVSQAVTTLKCGWDDDYQEVERGPVFVKEECSGAPIACQKGFCPGQAQASTTPTGPTATPRPGQATNTPVANTPVPGCASGVGLATGRNVTVVSDGLIRNAAGIRGSVVGRGENRPATITGGPECVDNLVWWQVDLGGGVTGWTAERDQNNNQLLNPR